MPTIWPFRARRLTGYVAPAPPIAPFTPILPWQTWSTSRRGTHALVPGTLGGILTAIRAMIVDSGLFPAHMVIITLEPEPPPSAGSPLCLIVPGKQRTVDKALDGGGRYTNVIDGEFDVHIIHRAARDHAKQDNFRLTDTATGVYTKMLQVADLLLLAWPADPAGNPLTIEPIRDEEWGVPRYYGESFMYSGTPMPYEMRYLRAVTQKV